MGCGASKSDQETDGRQPRPGAPRPSQPPSNNRVELKATSSNSTATSRSSSAARLPEPTPKVPNDGVNSAKRPQALQFASPRGNLPVSRVTELVASAPPPPNAPLKGMFPKHYRNNEGTRENPRPIFESWEAAQPPPGSNPANAGDTGTLFEYPVKRLKQSPPLRPDFDFTQPPATLRQLKRPAPNDRANYEKKWNEPPNDPGAIRAVTYRNGQLVGAMYHPEHDKRGIQRARLAPLDRDGRGELARGQDRMLVGRATWPERGSNPV